MRILIVSGLSPYWSSNFGFNIASLLLKRGYEVDFLSKDEICQPEPWMHFVYPKCSIINQSEITNVTPALSLRGKLMYGLRQKINLTKTKIRDVLINLTDHLQIPPIFSVIDERKPGVPLDDLRASLPDKSYDKIYVLFWWGMISALSLELLYNKYRCEIIVFGMDMSAMTGGCHYFGDCRGFKRECRNCPATRYTRVHKLPHINYVTKKSIYNNPDFKFTGNTWMHKQYLDSGLIKPQQLIKTTIYIDSQMFKPVDVKATRLRWGIPSDKFVLFCGASFTFEIRKGFSYLQTAFRYFVDDSIIASRCILLMAGEGELPDCGIETCRLGRLDMFMLSEAYAISDVYLSPSVDDAGPSMVNQSLMCGTPVVAFDIGTAVDCVITGYTGYRAKLKDARDFCNGMRFIYNYQDRNKLRSNCRALAMASFNEDNVVL